jgi:hypothetical protein
MSSSSSTANLFCFFVTGVDFAGWSPSSHFVFQARLVPTPLDRTIVDNKGVIIDDAPPSQNARNPCDNVMRASASNDGANFWHTFLDADDELRCPTAPMHKTTEFISVSGCGHGHVTHSPFASCAAS